MSSAPARTSSTASPRRLVAAGSCLRDEAWQKYFLKGVTYGPFRPNARDEPWPEDGQLHADLTHIAGLGFNTVRIYEAPSEMLLQSCRENHLHIIAGIPWTQHVDFFADETVRADAIKRVRQMARRLRDEPAVIAFCIGNEIEKTLVRWMGPERVRGFLEKIITVAKAEAPGKLLCYASYPSTEYLTPRNADFVAFNVFLEERAALAKYLHHLQVLAHGKPLVITEFGLDAKAHGEAAQAATFLWFQNECRRAGIAGACWFSYTDEWWRGGREVIDWQFGIVTRERAAKAVSSELGQAKSNHDSALRITHSVFQKTPNSELRTPNFSVIVCTRNGSATLRACLEALSRQTHSRYEVLVIDDGSTDATADIVRSFDFVRYQRQEPAGLSAARNLGMTLAQYEILAYTDDDCIPDEDWLHQLALAFDDEKTAAAGGPNLPPAPRTMTEAAVAAAPGAPAQVLLNDFEAEHLPGCNLAIRKSALQAVGGFLLEFTTAGDDVDVCWRLHANGGRLCFVPAAFVWHHRRATMLAYLRQQVGYGRAEALLMKRYPQRFSWLGGARWGGAIYGDGEALALDSGSEIYYGRYGGGLFQTIYASCDPSIWVWPSGLLWLELVVFLLALPFFYTRVIGGIMALCMMLAAARRARRTAFQIARPKPLHHALLFFMCLAQPVVRDWGRFTGRMMRDRSWRTAGGITWPNCFRWSWWRRAASLRWCWWRVAFTHDESVTRECFIETLLALASAQGNAARAASDSSRMDVETHSIAGMNPGIATVTEYHDRDLRLTRVSIWERPSRWLVFLAVATLLLEVSGISWRRDLVSALPLAGMFLLSWFWSLHTRRLILRAAAQHGMIRVGRRAFRFEKTKQKPLAESRATEETS